MIWFFYYCVLLLIFLSGILCLIKKKKIGFLTTILTPIFAVWIFLYWLHRDWINGQTEFAYFLEQLEKLSVEAILIGLLFLALIVLFLYNMIILIKETKK